MLVTKLGETGVTDAAWLESWPEVLTLFTFEISHMNTSPVPVVLGVMVTVDAPPWVMVHHISFQEVCEPLVSVAVFMDFVLGTSLKVSEPPVALSVTEVMAQPVTPPGHAAPEEL